MAWIRRNILRGADRPQALFADERRVLQELAAAGFAPRVIYDVGGSNGVWSEVVSQVVPQAEFYAFEPLAGILPLYRTELDARLRRVRKLQVHPIALADYNGSSEFFVSQDGWGSSLHDRGDIPEVKERIRVPVFRLDDYAMQKGLPPPDAIKIDTQGAEAVILKGAENALKTADVLFLETWLVRGYGPSCPLLGEIMEQLQPHGFTLTDFGERFYDDRHRLYSVDAFFLSERMLDRLAQRRQR